MKISYAQNFEDIFLDRCFGCRETGFYIDVGASSPVRDSVTYASYIKGWSGINIEPIAERFSELVRARPRDINLNCIASSRTGIVRFYRTDGIGGLSSCEFDAVNALADRGSPIDELSVSSTTLDIVVREHNVTDVQFLKIDAEGHEMDVLTGFSFELCRPEVLIIEVIDNCHATTNRNNIVEACHKKGYNNIYFDGVNEFFIRDESLHLKRHFDRPISVLDGFVPFRHMGFSLNCNEHIANRWARNLSRSLLTGLFGLSKSEIASALAFDIPKIVLSRAARPADIDRMYQIALGRPAGSAEIEVVMGRDPPVSTGDILVELISSPEFWDNAALASAWAHE